MLFHQFLLWQEQITETYETNAFERSWELAQIFLRVQWKKPCIAFIPPRLTQYIIRILCENNKKFTVYAENELCIRELHTRFWFEVFAKATEKNWSDVMFYYCFLETHKCKHIANSALFFLQRTELLSRHMNGRPSRIHHKHLIATLWPGYCIWLWGTRAFRLNVIVTEKSSWLRRYKTSILLARSGTCCSTYRENERTISLAVC